VIYIHPLLTSSFYLSLFHHVCYHYNCSATCPSSFTFFVEQWFPTYGSRTQASRKISVMAYFCLYKLHEKIRSLISFATAYNSEQSTLFRCSLTRKITSLFFSHVPVLFLYRGSCDYILSSKGLVGRKKLENGCVDTQVWA
jgi:hypothetical protein